MCLSVPLSGSGGWNPPGNQIESRPCAEDWAQTVGGGCGVPGHMEFDFIYTDVNLGHATLLIRGDKQGREKVLGKVLEVFINSSTSCVL